MNDQEKNEAIAKRLGWERPTKCTADCGCDNPPDYLNDIRAAWEVVEKCPMALIPFSNGHWYATTQRMPAEESECFEIWAPTNCATKGDCLCEKCVVEDTAPRAICEAFLKLP